MCYSLGFLYVTYLALIHFALLSKSIHCSTACAALPVCAFIYCLKVSGRQLGQPFGTVAH